MALTVPRFLAITLLGCAAIAAIYLPPRTFVTWPWGNVFTPEYHAAIRIDNALRNEIHALRLLEKRDVVLGRGAGGAAERWSGSAAAPHVDPAIPTRLSAAFQEVLDQAADSLPSGPVHFAAALFLDTATRWHGMRLLPPRRHPDIRYLLPGAIVGDTCLTIVTLGPTHRDDALEAEPDEHVPSPVSLGELVGPCGLVAEFGLPGAAMASWIGLGLYEGEAALGARCRDGDERACDHLLFRFLETPPPRVGATRFSVRGGYGGFGIRFTPFDAALLRGLADSVGTRRFTALWRADGDLAAAFERAAGVPATQWIQDLLTPEDPAAFREGDRPSGRAVLQGLGLVAFSVLVAMVLAARREAG